MPGRRVAMIVANDRYDHEGLKQLRSPAADADALARVLGDPAIGGFEVTAVHNEAAHEISHRIEDFFADSRPDDVLLLHFSCHGLKSESGELFFAATGTRPDRLASTAVPAEFVQRCMRFSRSGSIVLLLDCCYGGAFSPGVTVRAAGDVDVLGHLRGGGRGRAVITASSAMEYAFEGDRLADDQAPAPSVFTSALVEGLRSGEADRDEDGWVSLNELYDYVFDKVRERNTRQTPSRAVEMQGELYLARSGRRRVKPQPIPPELRTAMQDDNMFSRMGAVTELRNRLSGTDLGLAAGALEALREMAATDISYVADAAAAAITDVETRVAEDDVRAPATVALLGPPLARVVTVEVSEPWLRATATDEGVQIAVAPEGAGSARGEVVIHGQVSDATIVVHAEPRTTVTPAVVRPEQPPRAEPLLAAGGLALVIGVALLLVTAPDSRTHLAEAHLILTGLLGFWLAFGPGERRGWFRVAPAVLGIGAVVTVLWMLAIGWYYFEAYGVDNTPLQFFWAVAGLVQLAGTIGRRGPTIPVDLLAGSATVVFGVLVMVLVGRDSDSAFAVLYSYFVVLTGLLWAFAGLVRRTA